MDTVHDSMMNNTNQLHLYQHSDGALDAETTQYYMTSQNTLTSLQNTLYKVQTTVTKVEKVAESFEAIVKTLTADNKANGAYPEHH